MNSTLEQGKNWKTAKLKLLPIELIDGDRSSRYPKRDEFQEVGIVFLNTTNLIDNRLDFSDVNYISEEKYAQLRKGKLRPLYNDDNEGEHWQSCYVQSSRLPNRFYKCPDVDNSSGWKND